MNPVAAHQSLLLALVIWIFIGVFIGWLAGVVTQGGGFGFVVDALIGILGSVVAGWLFPGLGLSIGGGLIGSILAAVVSWRRSSARSSSRSWSG